MDPSPVGSGSFCSQSDPWKSFGSSPSVELRVVAKFAKSENPDFTSVDALLYGLYSVQYFSLRRPIFKMEKGVRESLFMPKLLHYGLISSCDTVPLNWKSWIPREEFSEA
jgi:hypothetical protein